MYNAHFALQGTPFRNTPDTAQFFPGSNRGAILHALTFAIDHGEGLITVIGEVGSGKTMLCRMLARAVAPEVQLIYLPNPMLSPEQAIRAIIGELGIRLGTSFDPVTAFEKLNAHLLELHQQGYRAVLLVEEAQAMPRETLEQIRLLGNLETQHAKLLQVILFAQPELEETLAKREMRQLRDRISHAFTLAPLSRNEIRDYLQFRLAPNNGAVESLFSSRAVKAIYKHSRGMIRRVNLLADKGLLAAYARGVLQVDRMDIRLAARDNTLGTVNWRRRLRLWLAANALLAVTIFPLYSMLQSNPVSSNSETALSERQADTNNAIAEDKSATPANIASDSNVARVNPVAVTDTSSKDQILKPMQTTITDITAARLAATQHWLSSVDPSRYTLQLMTSFITRPHQLSGLKQLLQRDSIRVYADRLFLLPGQIGAEAVYVLSFAEFPDYQAAQQAINDIPHEFSQFKPLIRTVASLRTELSER